MANIAHSNAFFSHKSILIIQKLSLQDGNMAVFQLLNNMYSQNRITIENCKYDSCCKTSKTVVNNQKDLYLCCIYIPPDN